MSRSYKKDSREDYEKPKKMKPYMREDVPYKGKYKRGTHSSYSGGKKSSKMGNTKREHKLEVANANRSLKKGMRQKLKSELSKEVEYIIGLWIDKKIDQMEKDGLLRIEL